MRDGLPPGWTEAELQDVCSKVQDGTHFSPKNQTREGAFKYITAKNIKVRGVDLSDVTYVSEAVHREIYERCNPQKGDVLYIKDGATAGIATVNDLEEEFSMLSSVALLKPRKEVLHAHYLKWYLNSPAGFKRMTDQITGSAITRLVLRTIRKSPIPLAPFSEQQRIAAKLEALLGKVDACQQRLAKVPLLLKRFRQSVLAAACSGRLTADWREENPDVEPGQRLATRINAVRQPCRGEAATTNKAESRGAELVGDGEFAQAGIPESWEWVRFGSVIGELRNGVSARPNTSPPGTPMLRISAARSGRVDLLDVRYLPGSADFLPSFTLRDDDLLFTRYNGSLELLGVCGRVRGLGKRTMLYPDKLMRVRFGHDLILPSYAELFFQVAEAHDRIVARSKSSAGQNGVSGSDIKAQPFALPPLAEQREIVRRVEALLALADALAARYNKAKTHMDKLTPSLLAKAFRGDLVPQDPNDEPASALLARQAAPELRPTNTLTFPQT